MTIQSYAALFAERHGVLPSRIVVTPGAALLLALSRNLPPTVAHGRVITREFTAKEVVKPGKPSTTLGIFLKGDAVVAVDLADQ